MVKLNRLTNYIDEFLAIDQVPGDSSNNGLQVEGKSEIRKAVFAVDACLDIAEIAAEKGADFIFVHHGLSWKEGFKRLTGQSVKVFATLFKNDISLYGVHLPLDMHSEVGHNAQIAKMIGLQKIEPFAKYAGVDIGYKGLLKNKMTGGELAKTVGEKLNCKPKVYSSKVKEIRHVGVISGGAGTDGLDAAVKDELDCLITGEVYHSMWHPIQESGMTVIAAGHYATETPGIIAMMKHISQNFMIDCEFIDSPTGL